MPHVAMTHAMKSGLQLMLHRRRGTEAEEPREGCPRGLCIQCTLPNYRKIYLNVRIYRWLHVFYREDPHQASPLLPRSLLPLAPAPVPTHARRQRAILVSSRVEVVSYQTVLRLELGDVEGDWSRTTRMLEGQR